MCIENVLRQWVFNGISMFLSMRTDRILGEVWPILEWNCFSMFLSHSFLPSPKDWPLINRMYFPMSFNKLWNDSLWIGMNPTETLWITEKMNQTWNKMKQNEIKWMKISQNKLKWIETSQKKAKTNQSQAKQAKIN